jgi:hypothetical protein
MSWLDQLMDRLTRRGTKLVASGHPPDDVEPPTGSPELSEELQADYGADTPAALPVDDVTTVTPPADADEPGVGDSPRPAPTAQEEEQRDRDHDLHDRGPGVD